MKEVKIIIEREEICQMKAIAMFIQTASQFKSNIHIQNGEKKANAKSLLGLMSLGFEPGMEVMLVAEGSDEEEAIAALQDWIKNPILEE